MDKELNGALKQVNYKMQKFLVNIDKKLMLLGKEMDNKMYLALK